MGYNLYGTENTKGKSVIDRDDFIRDKHNSKKYRFHCDSCGKDRGYMPICRRGGHKTGPLCVRCENGGSEVQKSNGYCKFCKETHILPEISNSNEYWHWEQNKTAIHGGYFRCRKYLDNKRLKWKLANPEKYSEKQKRSLDKYKSTIKGKLRSIMSSSMSARLKKKNYKSKLDHVDWSIEELMKHLESKFQPGMTWDNYGRNGWHIDHVKPDSWFNYQSVDDEEFKQCWSLNNLQPLWAKDNLSKGDRYEG